MPFRSGKRFVFLCVLLLVASCRVRDEAAPCGVFPAVMRLVRGGETHTPHGDKTTPALACVSSGCWGWCGGVLRSVPSVSSGNHKLLTSKSLWLVWLDTRMVLLKLKTSPKSKSHMPCYMA